MVVLVLGQALVLVLVLVVEWLQYSVEQILSYHQAQELYRPQVELQLVVVVVIMGLQGFLKLYNFLILL
jgi:hypothetical protein